ncbi:MAG: hypothetical protein C4K58_07340 [Flavobacteriaceae bacterium]|nr:MAG: hypothetical protein C4K58_07340 [Flavobacteriaceae bacterium]
MIITQKILLKNFEIQSTFKFRMHFRNQFRLYREEIISKMFEFSAELYLKTLARSRKPWDITIESLLSKPKESLGYAMGEFLQINQFQLQPRAENHDVFHVLTGYKPTVEEEVGLQFLLLGNGKRSLFLFVALLGGFCLMPEAYSFYQKSYQKGKNMLPFTDLAFEDLLDENLLALQNALNKNV